MFKLRFLPLFAEQKKEVLALTSPPAFQFPATAEAAVESIAHAHLSKSTQGSALAVWRSALKSVQPLLIRSAAFSLLAAACAASSTLLAMQVLKPDQGLELLLVLAVGYFASNLIAGLTVFGSSRLRAWLGLSVESHLVGLISGKLARLSSIAAARQTSGNLKTLITSDTKSIGLFFDNAVRNLIPSLAALLVVTPLLAHFAGRAGLIGLGVMTLLLPFALVLTSISSRLQTKGQAQLDSLTTLAGEWVKNIRLIRYLSWNSTFERDISNGVRKFLSISVKQHFLACLIYGFSTTWWMLSVIGVSVAARALGTPLDLAGFFGSLWLLTFLAGYFTHLPNTIRLYGEAAPSVRRIARLLGEEEQQDTLLPGETLDPAPIPRFFHLEQVSFRYPGGVDVIRELTATIDLSDQLAIIGEVGSGKTTLLKLLCGELPPTSGTIWVEFEDGEKRNLWSRPVHESLRKHLAYVPQEPFVSNDHLGANITLAGGATHDLLLAHESSDITDAAYWAELETDIAAFPQGLAQEIGEGGVNLSGGQRQRLNLARARFSGRHYLLLDDTLSAVDTRTERLLMNRLSGLEGGFALVTHRTGELMRVERVMVMQAGRFVEEGAPLELADQPDSHFMRVMRAYEHDALSKDALDATEAPA